MKLHRLLGALCAALLFILPSLAAEQASYVTPSSGPMNMATFTGTHLNPALRALASCHNGSSAPANGPSGAPLAYQCWVDTSSSPSLYKIHDGSSWITLGSINTSSHVWIPAYTGDNVVARNTTDTLTNKSLNLASNTLTGSPAQWNAAVSGGDAFTFNAGSATLTNKVMALGSNTISGTRAQFNTALSDDDFATLTGTETLTNKSLNLGSNTLTGTRAQFNSALSDDNFATLTGTETLTNKTISLGGNALSGNSSQWNGAVTGGDSFTFNAAASTLTNKTFSLGSNTFSGTIAQFNAALSDGDFATLAGTETLTNKTLTAPQINSPTGIVKGDVGLGNVDNTSDATKNAAAVTLTNKTIASPALTGTPDVQGAVRLSSFVTATQITANQNNYTATDGSNTCATKQTLRISSDASRNVTGLSCSQAEGDIRLIHNVGSQNVPLLNEDSNSTAANRFAFGGDVTLQPNYSMAIRYDGVASRWRAITTATGGGGGGGTVTSVTVAAGPGINVSGTNPITTSGTVTVSQSNDTIGEVIWMTTSRVPTNHLKADGSTVSRATFPLLAAKYVIESTVTFTNGSDNIGWTAHGMSVGDRIKFFTTGTLPTNFAAGTHGAPTAGTSYCVQVVVNADIIRVAATCGGGTVIAGSAGSGTHTGLNSPWGDGDGSTTFTLPNFVGQFLRGWNGTGSGTDANRMFGSAQTDAFQGHRHSLSPSINSNSSAAVSNTTLNVTATVPQTNIIVGDPITDGVNGTPRTASETRPVNYTAMPVIRYQ